MDINRIKELAGVSGKIVFHGGDHVLATLDPKWMLHDESNNQEGVGIYFSPDISVAQRYGPKISYTDIAGLKIVSSRDDAGKHLTDEQVINMFKFILSNDEDFWYKISDYVEVAEPDDVEDHHLAVVWDMMKPQELRNWQSEICMATSNETFVAAWNKFTGIDGTYETDTQFYAIINPNVKVIPIT